MYGRNTHAITLEDIRQRIKMIKNAVAKYFMMTCVIGLTLYRKLYQPVAKGRKPSHFFLVCFTAKTVSSLWIKCVVCCHQQMHSGKALSSGEVAAGL